MNAQSPAAHLIDFGRGATQIASLTQCELSDSSLESEALSPEAICSDETQIQSKIENAVEEAMLALRSQTDAKIAEMETAHEHACAERIRQTERNVTEALVNSFRESLDELTTLLADEVGDVLEPFVSDGMRTRIVFEFINCVRSLFEDSKCGRVVLRGPRELIETISRSEPFCAFDPTLEIDESSEIIFRMDRAFIRARFEAWREIWRERDDSRQSDPS